MPLTPVSKLIRVKPRPETTLQLKTAIADPVGTVSNYVFTPTIREYFTQIMEDVGASYGQGFWVQSEYGGGKTHFLATLAALFSHGDEVAESVEDDETRGDLTLLKNVRLFPVAFTLIGSGPLVDQRQALYRILETEVALAAQERLGKRVAATLDSEIERWWEGQAPQVREVLSQKCQQICGVSPEAIRQESLARWAEAIRQSAAAANLGIPMQASPYDRLKNIYSQLVNEETGYTGLLIIIDEFSSWQDRHAEGTQAYSEDESLLQTLAERLTRDDGLPVFTVIASQKPVPTKFQGDRFRVLNILSAGSAQRVSTDFEMIVARRVRDLIPDMMPEIDEYYESYKTRFKFAKGISPKDFRSIFPVQPLCFDLLRRITAELASARVGINVLWDVLAQEDDGGFKINQKLDSLTRLITASDLLDSQNLTDGLQSVRFKNAYLSFQQATDTLKRLRLDPQEMRLAQEMVRTLFLWSLGFRGQSMPLPELVEALVPEEGPFESPEESVLSVAFVIKDLPQLRYDKQKKEFQFRAEVFSGSLPAEIFEQYKAQYGDPVAVYQRWQEHLTSTRLSAPGLQAIFAGYVTNQPQKAQVSFKGVEYPGEVVVASDWQAPLCQDLPFDQHFRLVYLLKSAPVTSDILDDHRIAVCMPGELADEQREAVVSLVALDKMEQDYGPRDDDEALRVRDFAKTRRAELVADLLRAQPKLYRTGAIVTKSNLAISPALFEAERMPTSAIAEELLAAAYRERPLGTFKGRAAMRMSTDPGLVFQGLFHANAPAKARDALDNYAVGLGLARPESPRHFDPSACPVFKLIRDWFWGALEAGHAQPRAMDLYARLGSLGIPARLATLYLLCYVRRADEQAELLLKHGHRLRFLNGTAPPGDRLTAGQIPQIDWQATWADGSSFDALVRSTKRSWNDCLQWTRLVSENLKTASDPKEIEAQEVLLRQSLGSLTRDAKEDKQNLLSLQQQMGRSLPPETLSTLDKLAGITSDQSYEELVEICEECFESPEQFGASLALGRRAHQLAQQSAAILAAYSYLSNVPPGRLPVELEATRTTTLLPRFDLGGLARDPGLWASLPHAFGEWKRGYAIEYAKFHRDYQTRVAQADRLREVGEERLRALAHLEEVEGLVTRKLSPEIRGRWQAYFGQLVRCPVDVKDLNPEGTPHCQKCQVRYGDKWPEDPEQMLNEVDRALKSGLSVLQSTAYLQLLKGAQERGLQALHDALAIADMDRIISLLQSPESVQLLRQVVKTAPGVRRSAVIHMFVSKFPSVSRINLEPAVAEFRRLLEEDLSEAEARTSGPGAEILFQ